MDDHFHLSLRMVGLEAAKPKNKEVPPPSMPAGADENKDPTVKKRDLELENPVQVEDNSDPYNSTGRFNIKDVDW